MTVMAFKILLNVVSKIFIPNYINYITINISLYDFKLFSQVLNGNLIDKLNQIDKIFEI